MNLFALTSNPSRRIVRFPLSQAVQADVKTTFQQQEKDFNSYIQEEVPFDGHYRPDDGECLKIEDYDDIDNLLYAVKNPMSIVEVRPDRTEFDEIKALFSGYTNDGSGTVLIQHFDKKKILSPKGLSFFLSGQTYNRVEGIGLTLDTRLSLVLQNNCLKFFSFHLAKQILDLSQYYKEATDDDLKTFAGNKTIQVADVAKFTEIADGWVRRKVAFVMQSGILDTIDLEETKKKAALFGVVFETADANGQKVILLPSEKAEIKKILRFLDEDYFESVLLGKPHLSSAKRAI